MPIYEYQCAACGQTFERLIFKGDKEAVQCAACNSGDVEKLPSAVSFMSNSVIGRCGAGSASGFS